MPLDVARLRVLVEVAHAGSIAAAARRMSFTPSALSQQLAKLEGEVSTKLLDRGPDGVRLTPQGQLLVEHGERVLGELREAEAVLAAALGAEPPAIALGTFATAGTVLVAPVLAALHRDHPGLRLSLRDLEPPDGYGLVASGDLDVLITHRYPGMPSTPVRGLVRRNVLIDPLHLVLPRTWTDPAPEVPVRALADLPWISGAAGVPNRVCLEDLARSTGLTLRVDHETADYALTLALVRAGLGVALVPGSLLTLPGTADGVAVRRPAGADPAREICVVHRHRPTTAVRRLLDLIARSAARVAARLHAP